MTERCAPLGRHGHLQHSDGPTVVIRPKSRYSTWPWPAAGEGARRRRGPALAAASACGTRGEATAAGCYSAAAAAARGPRGARSRAPC